MEAACCQLTLLKRLLSTDSVELSVVALFLVDVVLLLAEVVNVDVALRYADVLLIVVVVVRVVVGLLLVYFAVVDVVP